MPKEEEVYNILSCIKIADKHCIGAIMSSRGFWKAGTSAINNSYKALNNLVSIGKLERGKGYYRIAGCKSAFKEHSRLLTEALTQVLIAYPESIIYRELVIPEISLRPDAAVLLTREGKGRCFILEVVNNETELYLNQKITALRTWKNSLIFLSELFKYRIPHFDIVVSGDSAVGGTSQLKPYLEEVD